PLDLLARFRHVSTSAGNGECHLPVLVNRQQVPGLFLCWGNDSRTQENQHNGWPAAKALRCAQALLLFRPEAGITMAPFCSPKAETCTVFPPPAVIRRRCWRLTDHVTKQNMCRPAFCRTDDTSFTYRGPGERARKRPGLISGPWIPKKRKCCFPPDPSGSRGSITAILLFRRMRCE